MIIKTIPISRIRAAVYNPRKDLQPSDPEYKKLKKSITEFDIVEPLIWNETTGNLVGGHQRLKILQEMGRKEVEVSVVKLSDAKEKALNLALNKISGEWDFPKLKDILEELNTGAFDIEITGFDDKEIEELMTQFHVPGEGLTDDDAVPEAVETICKMGDLWQLGNHRLLCGDATKKDDVERLMGGEKADMVFTDPPYGIDIVHRGRVGTTSMLGFVGIEKKPVRSLAHARAYRPIKNDDKPFDPSCILEYGTTQIIFGANNFASKLPDSTVWLVWDKKIEGGLDHNNFSDVELIWTNSDKKACLIYRHLWSGLLRQGDRKTELKDRVHPTQKPVGLLVQILQDFVGDPVLDMFLGSGSTLIACEKLGRRCYGMEIDEHYCDVILRRWSDFTGKQPVLIKI